MRFPSIARGRLSLFALLFLATLAAYWPALRGGFIWNDSDYVTKPALQSVSGFRRIWFEVGATEQFYPLLHSAFWVEHRLWGDAPLGYHLVNILFHATSACLLLVLLERLFGVAQASRLPSLKLQAGTPALLTAPVLAAFLFALHPVYVESVAWIAEQKNTLSTVFYLLAVLAYLKFDQSRFDFFQAKVAEKGGAARPSDANGVNPSHGPNGAAGTRRPTSEIDSGLRSHPSAFCYVLALAFFILALLTKTVTATLPGALLVIIWWQRGRLSWKRDALPLIPWFIIGAASGLFSGWVERTYVGASGPDFDLSLVQRGLVAGHAFWFYLGKLLWPANLIFIYPRWTVSSSAPWQYTYPVGVVALVVALWLLRKHTRAPLAALLFFLGSLFPVCGLFNLYAFIYSYVADHWQYVPSLGMIVLAAAGWESLAKTESGKRKAEIGAVAVICLLGALTYRQSGMYNDMETFYRRTIARNPDCWMAENNLGDLLEREGRLDEAAAHYERALGIKPSAKTHYNLGTLLREQHRMEEAIYEFQEALHLAPNFADARNNLAGALGEVGRPDEAIAQLEIALKLDPQSPGVRSNLGIALGGEGRYDEAIAQFQEALRLDPGYAEARSNLGVVLRREGRYPEAIDELRRALQLKPALPMAHVNLGIAYAMEDRLDEAVAEFREAIRFDPNYAEAHNDLGNALSHQGRIEEARAQFLEALRLKPDFTDAQLNLDQLPPPSGH